jgi:uncharacterized iron-regulated membrane protein
MTRAAFFRFHSWLGIVSGVFMLVIAWSGALVVFNDEIEWLLNPAVRADPALGVRPLDARHPDRRFAIHFQIGPHWAHTAYVYEGRRQRFLQIDPATAEIRRDDVMEGYTFNVAYFLRQLHIRLLMGYWGRVFVGVFGVTLVLSVLSSLWIYREWLQSLVRVRRGHGRRILYMDVHKAIGLWALAFNLVFGVTGAVLGLENLYYRIWPAAPRPPATFRVAPVLAAPLTPGQALARVEARDPRFRPTSIEVPPEGPIVVRGDHPSVFIAEGASEYAVQRTTGVVALVVDARRAPRPEYLYNLLDPLHFGYFGERFGLVAGYAVEVLWVVVGLAPGVLAITGGVMWLERQRRRGTRNP